MAQIVQVRPVCGDGHIRIPITLGCPHEAGPERPRRRVCGDRDVEAARIAEQMAGDFARYEILTTAPAPPPFRYADLGDPSGAPPVDD